VHAEHIKCDRIQSVGEKMRTGRINTAFFPPTQLPQLT
jgi:hypothetical protein